MECKLSINSKDYHKSILMLINITHNLKLSNMEMDILACILNHNMEIIDVYSREIIRKELDKDKFNTNNYIVRLRNKKILITKPADKKLYVNPDIIEAVKDKKFSIEFELV